MSQHHFHTTHDNEKTHVLMGWDAPLQGYFLVIEKESDEEEPFWSNLTHHVHDTHPKTVEPFLGILKNLQITIPASMVDALQEDGKTNAGNKAVIHYE